jgi:sugar lactone lactonase YvrE
MIGTKRFAIALSVFAALLPLAVGAQPVSQSSAEIRTQLGAALERRDSAGVTDNALILARMEASLSDETFDRIAPLLDAARIKAAHLPWIENVAQPPIEALRAWFHWNAGAQNGAFKADTPFAEVPAEYRLVEGIAWDARTSRLFIGTVIDGRLAYRDEDKTWHEVPLDSPRAGLFGMAIDDAKRLLWIATGSVEQTAVTGERMAGLIAVNLDTLQVARRVPLARGSAGAVGDLTIAADGTVYVSNAASGAIHRCRPGCTVLEDWLPAGSWRNPQGMALADEDRLLYVADYLTGIWTVDTRSRRIRRIRTQVPTMLEGVDGLLMSKEGALIAIQNGTAPRRIVKLYRSRTGWLGLQSSRYVSADTRVVFPAEVGEPTLGTLQLGWRLLFVADGQWERYGPGGAIKDGGPLRPTPIHNIDTVDIIVTSRQ